MEDKINKLMAAADRLRDGFYDLSEDIEDNDSTEVKGLTENQRESIQSLISSCVDLLGDVILDSSRIANRIDNG